MSRRHDASGRPAEALPDSGSQARFTRMDEGTAEDWRIIEARVKAANHSVAEKCLELLRELRGDTLGFLVDRYEHSLQTASRAFRAGADEEMVVVALLHDIGDAIVPEHHAKITAEILRPFVAADHYWLLQHHDLFQGYYYFHLTGGDRNLRERMRGHPAFEMTARFCEEWDQRSFDPDYDTMPLATFEPLVRRVLGSPSDDADVRKLLP